MRNKLIGKNVKIGVALMTPSKLNYNQITNYYEGVVTDYTDEFIGLDNKIIISKKFIQIIEII